MNMSVAAIVRSLKPKFHVDSEIHENLNKFVRVTSWEPLLDKKNSFYE